MEGRHAQECEFRQRHGPNLVTLHLGQLQASKQEAAVSLSSRALMKQMRQCTWLSMADALAEGDVVGLGGRWLPPNCELDLTNIKYFAVGAHRSDLPSGFCTDDKGKPVASLQSSICALEALAQLMLLDARLSEGQFRASLGRICVRQRCAKMGVVCSTNKRLTVSRPVCSVLQAFLRCSVCGSA